MLFVNYGKRNLSRRKKSISSKKRMKKKRVGVRFFKALVICILLLGVICLIGGAVFAKKIIDNTPAVSADDILPQGYTTNITDQSGNVLETLKDSDSNRVYKTYEEITANSEYLPHAFVAIEDERFYEHNGIDLQGIIRAGIVGITNGFHFTEGASTLTQQLIKNNVFPNFVNESSFERIERKLQEQYLALQFEKEMSKEEILEAYMNTINLGQGCLGVQTAADALSHAVIITRIRGLKVNIATDYNGLGKVQYIVGRRNLNVQDTVYEERVKMTVLVPEEEKKVFVKEVMEGTCGQAMIELGEKECWFAQTENGTEVWET